MSTTKMSYDKSTKNTHVFKADSEQASIPTLYIKKTEFKEVPDKIEVTVNALPS